MKSIKLPKYADLVAKMDGTVYDTEAIRQEFRDYYQNVQEVLIATSTIERTLKGLITTFFVTEAEKKLLFSQFVVGSDTFTLMQTRRTAIQVLSGINIGKDKLKDLDDMLSKIIKYRNALIHGHPAWVHDKFQLAFFSGSPMTVDITDDYWDKLHKIFWDCYVLLESFIPKS
jgi:hypothetical protein